MKEAIKRGMEKFAMRVQFGDSFLNRESGKDSFMSNFCNMEYDEKILKKGFTGKLKDIVFKKD